MPDKIPALPPSEPDAAVLVKLAAVERVTLILVAAIALVNLVGSLLPLAARNLPAAWQWMKAGSGIAVLLGAFSLWLSDAQQSELKHRLSVLVAGLLTLMCAAIFLAHVFPAWLGLNAGVAPGDGLASKFAPGFASGFPGTMSAQSAGAFALLGIMLIFIRARKHLASLAADLLTFCLVLVVLVLVSGLMFAVLRIIDSPASVTTSTSTMLCLLLLTMAAFFRRAENGVFSILLGSGIGSRIARAISPLLLGMPFVREAARAHVFNTVRMPAHYTTAILASLVVMASFALMLYLAWRINGMEAEIHDLSLRDALTGLYNLRGFHLLAEQALRLAQRSDLPFSVLYIDLDDLKRTNDTLGHQAGSEILMEMAQILKNSFRETDVLGRIGGDEFAVAGQFTSSAISLAARQLEETAAGRNAENGRWVPLSFSVGCVTSEAARHESLVEMLAKADEAMYAEKRRKKMLMN